MMEEQQRFYKSVRIVEKDAGPVDKKHSHQQLNPQLLSGRITGVFVARQRLHVGTGLFVPPASVGIESEVPLIKTFHQIDGRLTIPGSSLKGPVRAFVETITLSCVSKTKARLSRRDYGECRYNARYNEGEICVACKLFGAMGYQGQVSFADAPMIEGGSELHYIPPQYPPKGSRERRHYPHKLKDEREASWPLEVCIRGSRFSLQVSYQNLNRQELGLLLLAFGLGQPPVCLKLGAGKSSGLGAVQFRDLRVQQLDSARLYESYDSSAAWQDVDVAACIREAEKVAVRAGALEQMRDDLGCSQLPEL